MQKTLQNFPLHSKTTKYINNRSINLISSKQSLHYPRSEAKIIPKPHFLPS